jgi:hypothetical protein
MFPSNLPGISESPKCHPKLAKLASRIPSQPSPIKQPISQAISATISQSFILATKSFPNEFGSFMVIAITTAALV